MSPGERSQYGVEPRARLGCGGGVGELKRARSFVGDEELSAPRRSTGAESGGAERCGGAREEEAMGDAGGDGDGERDAEPESEGGAKRTIAAAAAKRGEAADGPEDGLGVCWCGEKQVREARARALSCGGALPLARCAPASSARSSRGLRRR